MFGRITFAAHDMNAFAELGRIGHHQHAYGPLRFKQRTNLDTFAWKTGRLVVGVFDDGNADGPVDLIEVSA